MATEADIGEVILLKEKCLTPGELYQPPQTVDYLVKSGNMEVASNVEVEIVNSSFEGNAGVTAGEHFSESPLIAKVPDQETNIKQETCQAKEISHQGEKTLPEETQIKEEGSFKTTEVKETREHEVVDEIGRQTSDNTGSLKIETIEQPYLEVREEEILKEEMKENNDAKLKASNGAAMLQASKCLNEELPVLTTVHNSDTNIDTQASLKNEHIDNPGYSETIPIKEIKTERSSEEKSPDVTDPIEQERKERDISHDSTGEASSIPEPSLQIQSNIQENSALTEDAKDKLDSPSVTLATDRSSMQEETSNVASTEDSQDATDLNVNTNGIISSVDRNHVEISSEPQTKELSLQEVDKTEVSEMILETLREDYVKGGPQETRIEALGIKPKPDSYEDEEVIDEATTEVKLDSFVKHENGEKNIHEEMTMLGASALENRDEDKDAAVAGEGNVSQVVTALQNNQDESGKEKNLSSMELNQKIETAETEFHGQISGETHSVGQESILVESKELGQDSNPEPQGQLHEASGDRYDENKNESDSQTFESAENNANRVVTTEQSSETSENEIEKLEKVHEIGSQDQSEIRDGEMSLEEDKHEKEEACETEKHKSGITDDDTAKCDTEESGLTTNSTDFLHERMEQKFQAGRLHEAATALKDGEEEEEDEKTSAINDEITGSEKVTDEEIVLANATNLSSEVIKEETAEGYLQIDKETDVSKGDDTEEQIIEGTSPTRISLEAVEEAPVKNFKGDENNIDNTSSREILLESETAETVGSIGNEAKRSNEEIPDAILQSSTVQEHEILHSENPITSEDSSPKEISTPNDKENHTDQPEADTGEHKEILKGVEYLEQIMKNNEDRGNNEQILNVISAETEATLSQSNVNTVPEIVDLAQDDESEAETTKEENIINQSYIGRALPEAVEEDPIIFQKNESYIGQSNAEITEESIAASTIENIANETAQNAEPLIETIPTSVADNTASNECFETSTYDGDDTIVENQEKSSDKRDTQEALVDVHDIRNEILKDESLPSTEPNEKIEITDGETPDMKINELNATRLLEKEPGEMTNFETQEQVHEANGGDEVKNDETEYQACKGTENTDSQHLAAKETENTETSEEETEKSETVHASESKEEVENKDVQMSIEENIRNKDESCEEYIQKLETSDNAENFHTEEVLNHNKIEQNFEPEEISTSEGEENSRQTINVIDKESSSKAKCVIVPKITVANEVIDDENIKENATQLSSDVTKKETAESPQQAEKQGDITAAENTEEKTILQKSIEEEPIKNFQSYGKNSDKPSGRQNFEESETDETADEAKQTDTSPNSTSQSLLVTGHESSQSENQTRNDGSPAEEIVVDGSFIKVAEDNENHNELSEGGEHSEVLLKGEEDAEQTLPKDNTEQPLHVISLETKSEALSQIDNIMATETAQSQQENEERDAGRAKDDILLKGEEDTEQLLQNDTIEVETEAEASSQTDNSTVQETAESPQENEVRDAGKEKEADIIESNSKCFQLESVAQNTAKDFENDDKRIQKSNTQILGESEVAETGENIIHKTNQTDETPNETIQSSLVKEAESLLFEDKGIPEHSSPEEKKKEGSSIMLLEEYNEVVDKQTSEPVHFVLETNQNEENLNSSLQTSVGTETEQKLQEKPQEKREQPLEDMEETNAGQQDDERDANTAKQEDGASEQDSVKTFKNDGDAAEKSNIEILEQPKEVESIENITHEIDPNDSSNITTRAVPAEDIESLQYEEKDIAVEVSAEEKKEEPYSIKTGEDNYGSIPVIEENKEGNQDTSQTDDYSAHDMIQNEESLNSSTQASVLREEATLRSDNLTPAEAFTKNDEDQEIYTSQVEAGEHNKEDAHEILQKVAQDPIKNFKNDSDGAEKSNKEILEQPKAEESVENITDETTQNDSPNDTNLEAPEEDVESLQFEDKEIAIEASAEEKKEKPSSVKMSEDSNDGIIMIEENNKECGQETCKTDDYSAHEMAQNEECLSSTIQGSLVREETVGSDNLTPVEASIKKDEDKESYTGLIDVEHNEELLEEENAEQILQKDEPKENIEESLNVISVETKAEALSELNETVDSPQANEKRDAGREKEDGIDKKNIRSLPMESVAQNPVKNFENDDPVEKTGQDFQDNAKNIENPEEVKENDPKEHIIDKFDSKSISIEHLDQGTTKEIQNDEDDGEISNKEILEESSKGEIGESIALETNQNYEITNTTAPVKGESLQDESENVNLEELSLEAEKEDDGSLAKASQINGCNAELAESTKQSDTERSHGEENMEPKLQNEPEEFLDSSSDVITQVSDIAILEKKSDEISNPEDLRTLQNNEKTDEEETKGNEDSDGSKLNDVSASEDIKLTSETYYASEADLETMANVSDYSEKNGEHISENKEKEMNEDNITKFQGDNSACMKEDTEKHIIMEEHLSRDISPQLHEDTNLFQENKEEIAQIEMYKEFEQPRIAEDTTQQVPEESNIENDQCTEPAIAIAADVAIIVPKTEMHEITQAAADNSNNGEQILREGREVEDILEVPLRGIDAEGLPEKDKDDENDKMKSKQEIEGIKTQLTEESTAVCYELEKVDNLKEKQGLDINLYPVKASEEVIVSKEVTELDAIYLESTSKEGTLGKEELCISGVIKDKSIEEVEQEDRKQLETSGLHTQEEGLERVGTTGTPLFCVSINAPQDEASNLVENKDHQIQTEAGRAEDLEFEIQEKALIEGNNNHNQTVSFATLSDKIPDDNLKESSFLASNDSELVYGEKSKRMDDNSAKYPTIHENSGNERIPEATELADNEDKITTAEEIPELAIEEIGKLRANEEAESYNSKDLNQDLELHNEQYQVDQQEICKSETSKDEESLNVGDEGLKCTESTDADKEEDILDKGGFPNKSEASLKEKDAAEKDTDERIAENINQVFVTTETESSEVPAEENLESAEPSINPDHTSEMVPSNQSNETIPKSIPNKFEENQISDSVEQRSQGSPGSWKEIEETTEPDLEDKNQINETIDVEDIKAAILTEEVYKEVEKDEGDETVEHFNKDGDDMKELHSVPTEGEIIHEVKESNLVSSEYLKATDSNEQTETESLEVRNARGLEKETSVTKGNEETKEEDEDCQRNKGLLNAAPTEEVTNEQIIDNADSSSDKIKAASNLEVKAEPRLDDVQIDEKPDLVSNILSDASSLHAAEIDAGQQDSVVFEESSSNLPSQLPTDDQGNVMLENVASENTAVNDIEESRETSDAYETKNHDAQELHTGEVREEIKEAAETVHRSQEKDMVTEAEDVIDHTITPPKEITKEPEVPPLAVPCKEDWQIEPTVENIEKHTEKIEMTKDKLPENSSALYTAEDRSFQIEVLDVSQPDLQVKKDSPDSPMKEHKEKGGTPCDTKEESEAASGIVSQSKCHNLGATEINEVADDQALHSEKSEEQYQTESESFVLRSKEPEFGCSTEIQKLEETVKGEELLGDDQRKSEEACMLKEESSELQVSEPELEAKKDAEESSNEAQMEVTSIEIDNKKEASESKLNSNSEDNEAAKEQEEEITPAQTNYTDKPQEENLMPSNPLLSEHESKTSKIIVSIEEKAKEMQLLEDKQEAIQDACLKSAELKVLSSEVQPNVDEQESLKETHEKADGVITCVKEETKEVSESVLEFSSQAYTAVSEDKITSNQPQPTEKSKEENQESAAGQLFEKQEHKISTIAESIEGKTTREEEPENAPKTIEAPSFQKEEPWELKPSELEMGDDIQNESQKKAHDGEDGTVEEYLKLQSQHEIEKTNAEETDLVALEIQGEKTTDATEVVHTETTNEQIIEDKCNAKSSNAITLGGDATKEIHQEHQQIIEGTAGAQTFEKATQNEVESSLETSRIGVAGLGDATGIIHNIHQQEKTSDSTLEDQISAKKEPESMSSTGKKEVVEVNQQQPNIETTKISEVGDMEDENGKAIEETSSKDSATISLQEMLQRSTREKQAREEKEQSEKTEKAKSDEEEAEGEEVEEEEEEEEGEERKKNDSGSDGPVMVERLRDMEVKIVQKKSHNILSGVGSKVKHSIIKVKKAITGKSSSSHTKQQQQNQGS